MNADTPSRLRALLDLWGVAVEDAIRRIQSGVEGRAVVFPIERRRTDYLMSGDPKGPTMFYVKVEAVDSGFMP